MKTILKIRKSKNLLLLVPAFAIIFNYTQAFADTCVVPGMEQVCATASNPQTIFGCACWDEPAGHNLIWSVNTWHIGEEVSPPIPDPLSGPPQIEAGHENAFEWTNNKLYAIRATTGATITWTFDNDRTQQSEGNVVAPRFYKTHVIGSPVNLSALDGVTLVADLQLGADQSNAVLDPTSDVFHAYTPGYALLRYNESDPEQSPLIAVRTFDAENASVFEGTVPAEIGQPITDASHDLACGNGFVVHSTPSAYVPADPSIISAPYDGYKYDAALKQTVGPIIPVNRDYQPAAPENDLIVAWYDQQDGVCWPDRSVKYEPQWPTGIPAERTLVIASSLGLDIPGNCKSGEIPTIYHQNNPAENGFNPNDEHAYIRSSRVYALRDDLGSGQSDPYAIIKCRAEDNSWLYNVFQVVRTTPEIPFSYDRFVGDPLETPNQLRDHIYQPMDNQCDISHGTPHYPMIVTTDSPYWTDKNDVTYGRAEGQVTYRYTERWLNEEGQYECRPWLADASGDAVDVDFSISWPLDTDDTRLTMLNTGEIRKKNDCSIKVIYDQAWSSENPSILDPAEPRIINLLKYETLSADLAALPNNLLTKQEGQKFYFLDLPKHLRDRLYFEEAVFPETIGKLKLESFSYNTDQKEPNVLSAREYQQIQDYLELDMDFQVALDAIYSQSNNQLLQLEEVGFEVEKAVTASSYQNNGYVTMAYNNDSSCAVQTQLHVFKVSPQLAAGELIRVNPDNAFEENISIRQVDVFMGDSENIYYQWESSSSEHGAYEAVNNPAESTGMLDLQLGADSFEMLKTRWYKVRYCIDESLTICSLFSAPVQNEGWMERVITAIAPFNDKMDEFHGIDAYTFSDMIEMAGPRYEGSIALNDLGSDQPLIELYETVLRRGKSLSIDLGHNDESVNQQLLFAGMRIADLYMLLGNEALADALDPTNGGTDNDPGSVFTFENITGINSMLDEELSLLRGRVPGTDYNEEGVYNRLPQNMTGSDTEALYAVNYNVSSESEAKARFPQGHGDAWGHFLTALKTYYKLLKDPDFDWYNTSASVELDGQYVDVKRKEGVKFAKAAAAKAKTGSKIVKLTSKKYYRENPQDLFEGYVDPVNGWGISGWATRSGQGAYFDWVMANALLPVSDGSSDIWGTEIDRATVTELDEIAGHFAEIQSDADKASQGMNPLGFNRDIVPFGLETDPTGQLSKTHFLQISERAKKALNHAKTLFGDANSSSNRLRLNQDELAEFEVNITQKAADYENRLVEIFGTPYPQDTAYPALYEGPDIFHYMYMDPTELMEDLPSIDPTIQDFQQYPDVCKNTSLCLTSEVLTVPAPDVTLNKNYFGIIKPETWTVRDHPGQLQLLRSELLQARGRFHQSLAKYSELLKKIENNIDYLKTQNGIQENQITILNDQLGTTESIQNTLVSLKQTQQSYQRSLRKNLNKNEKRTHNNLDANEISTMKKYDELEKLQIQVRIDNLAEINKLNKLQQEHVIADLLNQQSAATIEIVGVKEAMEQAARQYRAKLAEGEALLKERLRFRQMTQDDMRASRHKDLTFRIFRNEKLERYQLAFETATKFVFLAAKAFDYETANLPSAQGDRFLEQVVRSRLIGQLTVDGEPVAGPGLAGLLYDLESAFNLGEFENSTEIGQVKFSLRQELFRIPARKPELWREKLTACKVPDLHDLPEFEKFAAPFWESKQKEPGLVIPFSTTIKADYNFFGLPQMVDDNFYSGSNLSTKINSIGIWLSNYSDGTSYAYLIPVGSDVMWTYDSENNVKVQRTWNILNQKIPRLKDDIFVNSVPGILPARDLLKDNFGKTRRFSTIRMHNHESGEYNDVFQSDHQLIGRSVWNTRWFLIIPERQISGTLNDFIGNADNEGVSDILFYFRTYSYTGTGH